MSRWFRHYAGLARDDKMVRAAIKSQQPVERVIWVWVAILESAAEINDNGRYDFDADEAAYFLRADADELRRIEGALADFGRINEGAVAKWGDRQFTSDSSTERVKRFRGKRNVSGNVSSDNNERCETGMKRFRNAPETETETETEAKHTQSAREDILRVKADIVSAYWPDVPPDTGKIDVWIGQGYSLGLIAAVVPDIVRRKKPRSLSYCDRALDEAAQKRAPPHPPDQQKGEALVFIDQDSDAWKRAVAIEPKTPLQTKKGRGAYFAPDIAKQALAELPTQARA